MQPCVVILLFLQAFALCASVRVLPYKRTRQALKIWSKKTDNFFSTFGQKDKTGGSEHSQSAFGRRRKTVSPMSAQTEAITVQQKSKIFFWPAAVKLVLERFAQIFDRVLRTFSLVRTSDHRRTVRITQTVEVMEDLGRWEESREGKSLRRAKEYVENKLKEIEKSLEEHRVRTLQNREMGEVVMSREAQTLPVSISIPIKAQPVLAKSYWPAAQIHAKMLAAAKGKMQTTNDIFSIPQSFYLGKWQLVERRFLNNENAEEASSKALSLTDSLEFLPACIRSSVTGSKGMEWKIKDNSFEFRMMRGIVSTEWIKEEGAEKASVKIIRPPPLPYDQTPVQIIYRGKVHVEDDSISGEVFVSHLMGQKGDSKIGDFAMKR